MSLFGPTIRVPLSRTTSIPQDEKQLEPNKSTSSDAKLRPSLSLRPQFGAGCGCRLAFHSEEYAS